MAVGSVAPDRRVSEDLATVLSMQLHETLGRLLEAEGEHWEERFKILQAGLHEVRMLRRADHQAGQLALERERWEWKMERESREDLEREDEKARARQVDYLLARHGQAELAGVLGGGEDGHKLAALITRIRHGSRVEGTSPGPAGPDPIQVNQTKSDPTGTG